MVELKKINQSRWKFDGWSNILTNLGISGKDKRISASVSSEYLKETELEEFYGGDDVAARIVDRLPEEMTREGFKVYAEGYDDLTESVQSIFEKFGLDEKVEQGLKWARLYGGAGLIVGPRDGEIPTAPLNMNSIASIDYFALLNAFELIPTDSVSGIDRDVTSINFMKPKMYTIQGSNITIGSTSGNMAMIHGSRVIRFEGVTVPRRKLDQVSYWGNSILARLKNPISNYQTAHDSAAALLPDFAPMVISLANLADMMASGDDAAVTARLALINKTYSVINAIVLDKDDKAERQTTNVSGLDAMLAKIENRLVAATDYPHTILLGESPSGLGATGDSEKRDWYDYVKNQQESVLRPILKKILDIIFSAKDGPTKGVIPEDYTIEFCPLWQQSETEKVATRKAQAETDQIYINTGVLDPEEVADSRFGGAQYSTETKLNEEARTAINSQSSSSGDEEEDDEKGKEQI